MERRPGDGRDRGENGRDRGENGKGQNKPREGPGLPQRPSFKPEPERRKHPSFGQGEEPLERRP